MGNCCRKSVSSAAVWADDDWETIGADHHHKIVLFDAGGGQSVGGYDSASSDKNRLLLKPEPSSASLSSSSSSGREVKIKVSRRELEELMSRMEMQGLSYEQVLARLISSAGAGDLFSDEDDRHRHWRPALQSIPEV